MAKSYLNLITPPVGFDQKTRDASRRIVAAMVKYPHLIGGTGRLDTMIMDAAPGRVLSKVGADGVWLSAVLPSKQWPSGLSVALKIEDGEDTHARPVIAVDVLRRLGIIAGDDLPELSPMPIKNRRGDMVGRIAPQIEIPERQNL